MKSSTKVALVIALVFFVIGMSMMGIAAAVIGTDVSWDGYNPEVTEKERGVKGEFSEIYIDVMMADVTVLAADSDICRIVSKETQDVYLELLSSEGTLIIAETDVRQWYERIGISPKISLTVYLPQKQYEALEISSLSGDIAVMEGSFKKGNLTTASAEIYTAVGFETGLTAIAISGDVQITGAQSAILDARSTSGEVSLTNASADMVQLETTSGDISCKGVTAGRLSTATTSGDIEISASDATDITADAVSGDVECELLTGKRVETDTVSGSKRVQKSDTENGTLKINTVSGDIDVTFVK